MSIYTGWGFSRNPFETTPLSPDELGKELLVGRNAELAALVRRLETPPKIPTLEGLNGVGKSSLVNVATYSSYSRFLQNPEGVFLIPCRAVFQLRPSQDIDDFKADVYREVAQTLLLTAKEVEGDHITLGEKQEKLNRWLNYPQINSFQAGLSIFSGGVTSETNTGEGYNRSGFSRAVRDWLSEIFPNPSDGGVVCVIDNLELLQTSELARQNLEALRDELLTVPGLRWVLCGALGIVMGAASSPRLEGFLNSPLEIRGIEKSHIAQLFSSRIDACKQSDSVYLPLLVEDFTRLYNILSSNLRSLLGHSDDYCQWIADSDLPKTEEEKKQKFNSWLAESCRKANNSVVAI